MQKPNRILLNNIMDSKLRQFLFFILRLTFLPFLIRKTVQKKYVTIIVYHDIEANRYEKHLKYLLEYFNIISLEHYIKIRLKNEFESLPRNPAIVVFDDGHMNNYKLLPIIKKYNIPITIFLTAGLVGSSHHFWIKEVKDLSTKKFLKETSDYKRLQLLKNRYNFYDNKEYSHRQALSFDEINEMSKYVDFQSHTVTHPCLTQCTDKKSYQEIFQSKKQLESILGKPVDCIAFPNGDYGEREILYAKKAGYSCALTMDWGFNSGYTDLFRLKRNSAADNSSLSEFSVKISGLWWAIKSFKKKILKSVSWHIKG